MRPKSLALAILALAALLVAVATPSFAKEKDDPEAARDLAEFKRLWASKVFTDKLKAVQKLPGGYEKATKDVLDCLNNEDWLFRKFALLLIFQEKNDEVLSFYETQLFEKEKRVPVQEHLVWALYNNVNFANAERWTKLATLIGNVKKVDAKVRGRAASEMGKYRGDLKKPEDQKQNKDNVLALMTLLEQYTAEKKPDRLMVFNLSDALESLTGQEHGDEVKNWRNWWEQLGGKDKDLMPRQADKLTKDLAEIQLEEHSYARKRGREIQDLDVLFLPEFGYSGQYWQPYIAELNKIFACYMVSLPDASKVKPEPKKQGDGYVYPLPQLVEAFEKRRELSGQKKVGIIAHGVSGWIALQYARQQPNSVAFVVVISSWAGQKSFNSNVNNLQSNNNPVIKYYGTSLTYDPSGRSGVLSLNEEQQVFAYIGAYKRMFMDPYAVEPTFFDAIEQYKEQPGGGRCFVPDFEFKKGVLAIDVPALILWGAKDWCRVKEDEKTIPEAFKNPTLSIYENSYRMPWAEEPIRFFDDIHKMIEKYGIGKEDNKKDGKKDDKKDDKKDSK